MCSLFYVFPCSAVVLSGLLIWRLAKNRLWSVYPYLTFFIAYRLLADVVLFPINYYKPGWFAAAYWRLEILTLAMQFFVNWEFFHRLFAQRSTTKRMARTILWAIELGILPIILLLGRSQEPLFGNLHFSLSHVVEQYVCLIQGSMVLIPAAVAWYYGIPLNRNLRGLGFGFGVYVLARTLDFASVQAFHAFAPYWRMLTPMTFIIMIAVWLWAFWDFGEPLTSANLGDAVQFSWATEWQFLWSRTIFRLRRGIQQ